MKTIKELMCVVALCLCPVAAGGEFTFKTHDESGAWYTYSGYVEDEDASQLRGIMRCWPEEIVYITINSGGGSAYGGLSLFWEAERWDNLVTIAGKDFGAWSAAAVFWMGSPRDWFEGESAKVGFHQAYCNSWYPPGCDISIFRERLVEALDRAGYCGYLFDLWLTDVQATWGVEGWALLTDDGWGFYHSGFGIYKKIIPNWEIK